MLQKVPDLGRGSFGPGDGGAGSLSGGVHTEGHLGGICGELTEGRDIGGSTAAAAAAGPTGVTGWSGRVTTECRPADTK